MASSTITVGIGWDKERTAGAIGTGAPDIDLDATAVQFVGEQLFDLAFYNNLSTRDGSVVHLGDNLTGRGRATTSRSPSTSPGARPRRHDRAPRQQLPGPHPGVGQPGLLPDLRRRRQRARALPAHRRCLAAGLVLATLKRSGAAGCCAPSVKAWRSRCRRRGWRSWAVPGLGPRHAGADGPRPHRVRPPARPKGSFRRARSRASAASPAFRRQAGAAARRSRPRRPAWPRPRPRSCSRRSAACRPGRR